MIFSVDAYQRSDRPYTYLATPNKDYIGIIQSRELANDLCFNNISQCTFNVNKYEDGELTSNYDSIAENMLVEVTYVGWFQITMIDKKGNGENEFLSITALSLENEACSKTLTSFGQLGNENDEQGGLDRYCLYDIMDKSHSIMHIWLNKMPSWRVGFIDPEITKEYRSFNEDEVAAYDFLVTKVSETFECIFQFDTFEQTVSAYKLKNIGVLTDIYLSYENIIKSISVKSNNSDIKTVLTVTGGDDRGTPLGIIEVNPSGTNQIYNFSYFKHLMSPELQSKLNAYEIEYTNRANNFTPAIDVLKQLYEQLGVLQTKLPSNPSSTNWTEYGLAELNTKYNYYNERMALYIEKNDGTSVTNYNSNRVIRDAVEAEIKIRKSQITQKLTDISNQEILCNSLTLNLDEYLGEVLYKELSRYIHEDTFTDDTFVVTENMTEAEALEMKRELFKLASEKLAKVCKPSYSIEVDAINFTAIPEFAMFTQQLYLGNIITLDFGDDILVESRLLKLHINWDNPSDFSMTFSSKTKLDGFEYEFAEIQSQASTAGTAYGFNGTGWTKAKKKSETFNQYMTSVLDLAKQKLQSSSNQEFIADSTGTKWRKYLDDQNDYSPNQMWGTGNGLFLTQNKWNNVSMAIGEGVYNGETVYGIWAPVICGDLMLTKTLHITNENSSIIMNENGATFNDCDITINKGTNSIRLNATDGIQILNGLTKQFYIDIDGNVTSAGKIVGGTMNINNKFIVDSLGNATVNGNITAISGNIGGFTLDETQLFSGSSTKFMRISPYSTTPGTNNFTTERGAIDLGRTSDGLDTLIHLRSDGYARFGLNSLNGSVKFNYKISDTEEYSLYTRYFRIETNGFVKANYIESLQNEELWLIGNTNLLLGSDNGDATIYATRNVLINTYGGSFKYNNNPVLTSGNYSSYISTSSITPSLTSSGNIDFAGSENAAAVNWVQANYAPINHSHSQYATTSHSHSEYASSSHSHSNYATTSALSSLAARVSALENA